MSDPITTTIGRKIGNAVVMVIGVILTPIALIASPRWAIEILKAGARDSLARPGLRDRIQFETINTPPSRALLLEIRQSVLELVENGDWVQLSDKIEVWDQTRAKASNGTRLASYAASLAVAETAECIAEDETPILPAQIIPQLEGILATHPKCYPLAALCAKLRINQAWFSRGGGYSHQISQKQWAAVEASIERAIWLLKPFDATALDSPLLTEVRFGLLAFLPDANSQVHTYYKEWASLDPTNQAPHIDYGYHLLPRWYGSFEMVGEAAQKAYAATHDITGAAAYASVFQNAMDTDFELFQYLDLELYMKAINDLIDLTGADPAYVAKIVQDVHFAGASPLFSGLDKEQKKGLRAKQKAITAFSYHLARTRLTAIHPDSWECGVNEALDFISADLQDEIAAGHSFVMGKNGVEIIENSATDSA